MPDSAERWAVDTSVAVAALDAGHAAHEICRAFVREHRPALAGHAAVETFAVFTRMPGALSVDSSTAAAVLGRVFPSVIELPSGSLAEFVERCGELGVRGGAVYDALVGEAARRNDCRLGSRDHRARRTYDLIGVDYLML